MLAVDLGLSQADPVPLIQLVLGRTPQGLKPLLQLLRHVFRAVPVQAQERRAWLAGVLDVSLRYSGGLQNLRLLLGIKLLEGLIGLEAV